MANDGHLIEVVHASPPKGTVGARESGRLDQMRFHTEAGAQPQNRAGILRNVRLKQCNPHVPLVGRNEVARNPARSDESAPRAGPRRAAVSNEPHIPAAGGALSLRPLCVAWSPLRSPDKGANRTPAGAASFPGRAPARLGARQKGEDIGGAKRRIARLATARTRKDLIP